MQESCGAAGCARGTCRAVGSPRSDAPHSGAATVSAMSTATARSMAATLIGPPCDASRMMASSRRLRAAQHLEMWTSERARPARSRLPPARNLTTATLCWSWMSCECVCSRPRRELRASEKRPPCACAMRLRQRFDRHSLVAKMDTAGTTWHQTTKHGRMRNIFSRARGGGPPGCRNHHILV